MSSIFFKLEVRKKKRDFLSEKRESGMTLKKREFTPESGSVDTYVTHVAQAIKGIRDRPKLRVSPKLLCSA